MKFTYEWWGRPQYGWQFQMYRTARGGWAVVFGAGIFTWRRDT